MLGSLNSLVTSATFCVLLAFLCGCETHKHQASEAAGAQGAGVNQGYALLFNLLQDEKDVSKLLIIKRERAELKALIKEIAETSGRASKQLETFAKSDRSIDLTSQGLPSVEVQTRQAIAKQKAKELIVEGGKEFELRLLLSQSEALTYGAHLAETVAKAESNQTRAGYLRQLAAELHGLQRKVVAMLLANY